MAESSLAHCWISLSYTALGKRKMKKDMAKFSFQKLENDLWLITKIAHPVFEKCNIYQLADRDRS